LPKAQHRRIVKYMAISSLYSSIGALDNWMPQIAVWTSIIAGFSITAFLLIFSRSPFKLSLLLPRYSAATGAGLIVWIILLWWRRALLFHGPEAVLEFVAGGLIFVTAVFCNYYLGNISAGFRIEMLINLANVNREVTLDEWMAQYGKGLGMHYFLENRLNSTLLPWGLVVRKENQITLTRFGHFIGQINCFLASLFSEK
jgi:hypothetical protein